jgi:hypothetical protein
MFVDHRSGPEFAGMNPLRLEFWTSFSGPDGEPRELKDPEGPATPRQLRRLNETGCLVVVEPGQATPIRKGEAAYAVSLVRETEPVDDQPPTRWRFSA